MSKERAELADELAECGAYPMAGLPGALKFIAGFALTEAKRDMIVAALRADAVAEPVAALSVQDLAKAFRPRPRPCTVMQDWQCAVADAETAVKMLAHPAPAAPVQNAVKAACDRVNDLIADLEGEHAAMAGRPIDAENWKLEVPVTDLRMLCRAALGSSPAAPVPADQVKCGPMSEDEWKDQRIASLEAYVAELKEQVAAPVPASVREALEKIAKMCRPHASNEQFDGAILTIAEAALASLPAPGAAPTREEYAAVLAQELWCGATFADAAPSEREAFLRAADAILALKYAPAK